VITTELIPADLASVKKRAERLQRALAGDKLAKAELALCEKILPHLDAGKTALTARLSDDDRSLLKGFFLLTSKPAIFACNVGEEELARGDSQYARVVRDYADARNSEALGPGDRRVEAIVISAQIESELAELPPLEAREFLSDLGVADSGVSQLIRAVYHLLGLRTFLTTGPKETRAWTIHAGDKAPAAAGVIHSDFERGFIAAQTISFDDLVSLGSEARAREAGRLLREGKGIRRPGRRRNRVPIQRVGRALQGSARRAVDSFHASHLLRSSRADRRKAARTRIGRSNPGRRFAWIITSKNAFDSDILNLFPQAILLSRA
jgi:ribosome-binding ATPase YchF (GTP1/OBG family)